MVQKVCDTHEFIEMETSWNDLYEIKRMKMTACRFCGLIKEFGETENTHVAKGTETKTVTHNINNSY